MTVPTSSAGPTTSASSFQLRRVVNPLVRRRATVAAAEWLNSGTRRVRLAGDEMCGFDSPGADDHLRLFVPGPDPDEPVSREYTPVAWDADAGWLDLDLVVHSGGVASEWARSVHVGDTAMVGGPRGSLVFDGAPDWYLLAGDETALPAIRRFAAAVPVGAPVRILAAARTRDVIQDLPTPGLPDVTWIIDPPGAEPGDPTALSQALNALGDAPAGTGFLFIAAEQAIVKPARELLARWDVPADRAVVKGYWKRDG